MLLYSSTINSFRAKVKILARRIMNEEMGLNFNKTRFLWRGYYYPLHFVLFEDPQKLGYFSPDNFQLGLHKKLMYLAHDEVLTNIIRHELAHLYTFLLYQKGKTKTDNKEVLPHGKEFHKVCRDLGWGSAVYKAYSNLELENSLYHQDNHFEKIKIKIKKLLALSSSDNPHEAQMATVKANQLLLKYNLQNLEYNDEVETCVKLVYRVKKLNATMNALYDILQFFYVQPIYNRTHRGVGLDVVGTRLNVEMADYVAKYLSGQFEVLWNKAKKEDLNFRGLKVKNNYIIGLSEGFISKLKNEREALSKDHTFSKELVKIQENLSNQVAMAFPKLSRQKSSTASIDPRARERGKRDGSTINIHPGLSQGQKGHLLT